MCYVTATDLVSSSAKSFERTVWPTMILRNFQPVNTISKYHVHSFAARTMDPRLVCKSYLFSFHFFSVLFSFFRRNRNPVKIIFGFWCNRRRIDCWCAARIHFDRCAICIKSTQPRMHWRQRNQDKQSAHTIHSTIQRPFLSVSFSLRERLISIYLTPLRCRRRLASNHVTKYASDWLQKVNLLNSNNIYHQSKSFGIKIMF